MSWNAKPVCVAGTRLGWPRNTWISPPHLAVCCLPPFKASAKARLASPAHFHAGSCISKCREAAFLSCTAPQTWCNVVKGGYNHNRFFFFFSCGPETKPQLPVVFLQVLQLPGRRLRRGAGLTLLPPHSSFLGTYCQAPISVAHSPFPGILVARL